MRLFSDISGAHNQYILKATMEIWRVLFFLTFTVQRLYQTITHGNIFNFYESLILINLPWRRNNTGYLAKGVSNVGI